MSEAPNRRVLLAATGLAALAVAGQASALPWPFGRRGDEEQNPQEAPPAESGAHMHHDMAGMNMAADLAPLSDQERAVLAALVNCDSVGEACLSHCIATLGAGDISMAACAISVRDMLAVCAAARALVNNRSDMSGQQLAVCRSACAACRAQCQPHAAHHDSCRACAQACARAIAAIAALLG